MKTTTIRHLTKTSPVTVIAAVAIVMITPTSRLVVAAVTHDHLLNTTMKVTISLTDQNVAQRPSRVADAVSVHTIGTIQILARAMDTTSQSLSAL